MQDYEVLRIRATGEVIHVQLKGDILHPWGISDKKPPFEIIPMCLSDEEFEDVRQRARSGGGDGFERADVIRLTTSLKGLTDEQLLAEVDGRGLNTASLEPKP